MTLCQVTIFSIFEHLLASHSIEAIFPIIQYARIN